MARATSQKIQVAPSNHKAPATTKETTGTALDDPGRREAAEPASETIMPERAFEELRNDLATAGAKRDRGDIAGAYGYLARGVRMFLEQWMAEQEQRDEWANQKEADQYAIDARLEQGAYR